MDGSQKDDSSSEEDEFGQATPPLTVYLQRVLEKYPDGGQILKELVQNADDARAKNVIFMYDKSDYSSSSLFSPELRKFQGPALYAYNDAVFTDKDWFNIQNPAQSGKKNEPTKVGRFGLGFISVYHLTDLPSIMSGKRIGYLDPCEKCFGKGRKGKSWRLNSKRLNQYGDQIDPFMHEIFRSDRNVIQQGNYPATIFRFPLRQIESELSKTLYDDVAMKELFASYEIDAEISLLFLKSVESVSLYETSGRGAPSLRYRVNIAKSDAEDVRRERNKFVDACKAMTDNFESDIDFHIERFSGSQTQISRYITVSILKLTGVSQELQELINDCDLQLLPWVSVCMPFNDIKNNDPTNSQKGRLFCFLPLPSSESPGFPIHVHGYFGLNDNRRGIKWPDGESVHDKQAKWNKKIVYEVFPEAYAKLILKSIQTEDMEIPHDVYKCWPNVDNAHDKTLQIWTEGIVAIVRQIQNEQILYSDVDGGKWMAPKDVLLNSEDDTTCSNLLQKVMLRKCKPAVKLPKPVLHVLNLGEVKMTEMRPTHLREVIRAEQLEWLTYDEKVKLLEYIVSDDKLDDLENICLLPLRDGQFTFFSQTLSEVYIPSKDTPVTLIPNLGHRFAAGSLPPNLCNDYALNCTQLIRFDTDHVVKLLHEALPKSWVKGADAKVSWHPGKCDHPESDWLSNLWIWLGQNHRKLPLNQLKDIPLLPLESSSIGAPKQLVRLQPNTIIREKRQQKGDDKIGDDVIMNDLKIPSCICSFLEKIGVEVVRHELWNCVEDHPELNSIILPPTSEGLCEIMFANSKGVSRHMNELSPADRDSLRMFLSQLSNQAVHKRRDFLTQLPIFPETYQRYVAVAFCKHTIPKDFHGIPVSRVKETFICVGDENSKELLRKLHCHEVLVDEFLNTYILPQVSSGYYNEQEILQVMDWVLNRSQYDKYVKSLNFIPTASEMMSSPQKLFDPNDQELRLLFNNSSMFPIGLYSEEGERLDHIRRVGFRTASTITATELLTVAHEVTNSENKTNVASRAKVLFAYINCCSQLLTQTVSFAGITKGLSCFLEDMAWVPVCSSSLSVLEYPNNLPWFGDKCSLFKPREVAPYTTALLQGSTMPLVDVKDVCNTMIETFGWHRELDLQNYIHVERVVCHLRNVAKSHQINSEMSVYNKLIADVYAFLNKAIPKHVQYAIKTKMDDISWVWHGGGFTTTDKVAFDGGSLRVQLDPYLFILPKTMQSYKQFLSTAGVHEQFPEGVLCSVLTSIQKANEAGNRAEKQIEDDLSLVCDILNCIANTIQTDEQHSKDTDIFVPCRDDGNRKFLKLVKSDKCLYVDDERLLDEYARGECEIPVVHQKLPTATAKQLNLLRLSHYVAPTEAIDFGFDMEGPHETTVNAIRRNLDLYKEGLDIFKELIQNADDAGATEVKFLIDWRTNADAQTTLLNKEMKSCQGPAVWAFNNAQFTETDVKNICNIAGATKKRDLEKVGRFGLGFTSVYHLTDVPSVVSGPFVMIFDPRTTHLRERVTSAKPGIKLDLRNEKHKVTLRSFPDQFQPFKDVFGCNVFDGYEHTLFRLPLRSESEVLQQTGEILSDVVYQSKEKIQVLLHRFKHSASTLLLFTQNIEKITIHVLEDGNRPEAAEEILSVAVNRQRQLNRSIKEPVGDLRTERNVLKVAAAYVDNSEQGSNKGYPENTNRNIESSMILEINTKENLTKKKKPSKTKSIYFVSSCMSKGTALCKARSKDGRRAGILPCGGVAALLVNGPNGLEPVCIDGQAFSFLPLEISTGLPFHINGTFLLQPNRRQLWSKTSFTKLLEEEEFEIQWNICLMEDVICKAFLNLLIDLKAAQEKDIVDARSFQTLWPSNNLVHNDFRWLVRSFYNELCGKTACKSPDVIYNGTRWISLDGVVFTQDIPKISTVEKAMNTLINQHCRPKKVISFKQYVYKSMKESGVLEHFKTNVYTWSRFIESVFFPKLQEDSDDVIDSYHRDNIIQHLLDERIGSAKVTRYDDNLSTTECIPVTEDHKNLVSPCRLVHPKRLVGKLFHVGNMRFPNGDGYLKAERLHSLADLGMATVTLNWNDICERSEAIQCQNNFDLPSYKRSVILLGIIDQKLKTVLETDEEINNHGNSIDPSPEQITKVQHAPCLPVVCHAADYPFPLYNKETHLSAALDIYEAQFLNLVGCVHRILDETSLGADVMTHRLKVFLGLKNKEPLVEDIVKQLQVITKEENKSENLSTVSKICGDIYDFLQKKLCVVGPEDQVLQEEKFTTQTDQLRNLKFVFVDGNFVTTKQLAFVFKGHCPPFLYNVSSTLMPYANLLKVCGVRQDFQSRDFIEVVIKLQEKYQDNPMTTDDITLAHEMLQHTIDAVSTELQKTLKGSLEHEKRLLVKERVLQLLVHETDDNRRQLLAVDQSGIFQKTTDLTFNDMEWEENQTLNMAHNRLTLYNAMILGITTARERALQSCSTSDGFESPFGQTEAITDRLKSILRNYHHVSDVMKELLQNADDAKATEIHFVYDSRTHKSEKIIDSKIWGPIQTLPALCVYNNKQFSKEDIKGIQKIGVGGKVKDTSTAGRFGVGFNAVYHLTDCPTFLTNNEKLCIFDPHVRYVPGATHTNPGQMYDCLNDFQEKFPDMMTGYLGDKFTLSGATMFRFPLRSQEMSNASGISKEWNDDKTIKQLLKEFQKIAKDSLFFLKYIEDIRISEIGDDGLIVNRYCISGQISAADVASRQQLTNYIEQYKDITNVNIPQMTSVYSLDIQDTDGVNEKWMVAQTIGSQEPFEIGEDMQQRGLKRQIPRGGVAALVLSNQPIREKTNRWHIERRVYCFLPLPINSKLPVHVNGSFALDASRRHLAKSSGYLSKGDGSETCLAHPWNRHLVEKVIATAYAHLIDQAKVILLNTDGVIWDERIDMYYSVVPFKDYGDWNILKQCTLRYIGNQEFEVLPVIRNINGDFAITWHHPSSKSSLAFFDTLQSHKHIRSALHATRFKLVKGPSQLWKAFVEAGVKECRCVTPKDVLHHLANNIQNVSLTFPCALENTCFKTIEHIKAVIGYCLETLTTSEDLRGVPLRLTNNNVLDLLSPRKPLHLTPFTDLLPENPELFIHESLVDILQAKADTLCKSGMFTTFGVADLARYLHRHLPTEWRGIERHVKWTPGMNGHPTICWVQRLWEFLFQCGESQPSIQWPIIPTTTSTLVLPRKAKTVLYMEGSPSQKVANILNTLKCPAVSLAYLLCDKYVWTNWLPGQRREFLNKALGSVGNIDDVLGVFEYILKERSIQGILNLNQAKDLLIYFQQGHTKHTHVSRFRILKQLPLFLLRNRNLSSIDGYSCCHTCDCRIPMDEDIWTKKSSCVFLQHDRKIEKLYALLGITPITEIDIYSRYILPNFNLLSQSAIEKHMNHINLNMIRNTTSKEQKYFLTILQNLEWIPDATGVLQTARFYYDPHIKVFKAMVNPCKFIPDRYVSVQWHQFVCKLGLNQTVNKCMFLSYAQEIERHARCVTQITDRDVLVNKSKILLKELSKNTELKDIVFLKTLATVKFIQPVAISKELNTIFPAYQGQVDGTGMPAFISFSAGVPKSDMRIAWSVAMVLPSYARVEEYNTRKFLSMKSSITENNIIQHVNNVCNTMVKLNCCDVEDRLQSSTRITLQRVMCNILQYLQKHTSALDSLANIPMCLVDTNRVLVLASRIVLRLDKDDEIKMRPYLYRMTEHMIKYETIIMALGAQHEPTLNQLAFVLSSIHSACGECQMHPNEVTAAHTAVKLIFRSLISSSIQSVCKLDVLYLPTTHGYIKRSTDLCCADSHLKKNLPVTLGVEFVVELNKCGINDAREDPTILALLPKRLRPHNLGDSMVEKPCPTNSICHAGRDCLFLDTIRRCLVSEELQRALMRLLRHEFEGIPLSALQARSISRLKNVSNIICVEKLNIVLNDSEGKCLSDQPRERMVFLSISELEIPHVYIHHSVLPVVDCLLYRELAQTIISVCGIKLDSEHFSLLREVIACTSLDRMNIVLTKAEIPEYDDECEMAADPYAPGSCVPDQFICLLDANPYNRFQHNEIVGYESPCALSDVAWDFSNDELPPKQEYVFARVIKDTEESGSESGMKRRYVVDVGRTEKLKVSTTALYKFRRCNLPDEQETGESQLRTPRLPCNTVSDARIWITHAVEDAFTLAADRRKDAIRRLKRMWHPDKNPAQNELANAGFQFLQQEVERMENLT